MERRRFLRIDKEIPVKLKILSEPKEKLLPLKVYKAVSKNIGKGGIFIETLESIDELLSVLNKEKLLLEIELSPSATKIEAKVRITQKKKGKESLGLGLEFEDMASRDNNIIGVYLEDSLKIKKQYAEWRKSPFLKIENFFYQGILKKLMFPFAKLTKPLVIAGINLWVRKIFGLDNIPKEEGCILVANHTSYCDFLMISAFMKKWIYFLATRKLSYHPLMKYFMHYNEIIYIDRDNPGVGYLKKVIDILKQGNILVFFPEGTRSITGKIQKPKLGFVKLAIVAKVPIVPVGFKGTFEILPKHKKVPRLKRTDIFIGKPIALNEYYGKRVNKEVLQNIANDIMNKIGSLIRYEKVII